MAIDWSTGNLPFLRTQLQLGNVVLFAGAGFSFDAKNLGGKHPLLGTELAKLLAEKIALPYNGEPLSVVYGTAEKRMGSNALWHLLRDLYDLHTYHDWYRIVTAITWDRIYTLNIDNLFQLLYRAEATQKLTTIVCPAPPDDRDALFSRVQVIHLHGHINYQHNPLTFTLEDFARQTGKPNPWYQTLADDVTRKTVLFVGTVLEESPFYHYLELRDYKDRGINEFRPKSYLVCPNISAIRVESLKERNIQPISCTGMEFFQSLAEKIPISSLSATEVRRRVYPHLVLRENYSEADSAIYRYFDLIRSTSLPPAEPGVPGNFFLGAEATWNDIQERRDGARVINLELTSILRQPQTDFRCIVFHGPAGSGKTTTLMRTASDLSADGERVLFAKGFERIDLRAVLDLAKSCEAKNERLFVFCDVMARHLGGIDQVRNRLSASRTLTLVLAERSNTYYSRCQAIAEFNPIELRMPDLVEEDVVAILERLDRFGFLGVLRGLSKDEQVKAFMIRASKQLLVAMREATSGDGFDAILRSEFIELPDPAKLAYTICCLAVDAGAPGVYRRHLMPCLSDSEFRKGAILNNLLRGVLVAANESGTMVKPRHRMIATWVATEVVPDTMKREAIARFLQHLASDIVPNEIKRRSPAYLAYRGMINAKRLVNVFGGNVDKVISLYEDLRPYYNHDFLFWLQRGMAHFEAGHLDIAENFVSQSNAIHPSSHQTLHFLGVIYLTQAARSSSAISAQERAEEGIRLLSTQINERGDYDSYPYAAYLTYVVRWYKVAGSLVPDTKWEELRRVGVQAIRKYPRDEVIKTAEREVENTYLMRAVKSGDSTH